MSVDEERGLTVLRCVPFDHVFSTRGVIASPVTPFGEAAVFLAVANDVQFAVDMVVKLAVGEVSLLG